MHFVDGTFNVIDCVPAEGVKDSFFFPLIYSSLSLHILHITEWDRNKEVRLIKLNATG